MSRILAHRRSLDMKLVKKLVCAEPGQKQKEDLLLKKLHSCPWLAQSDEQIVIEEARF